jgi:hypothetical protein
MPLACGHVPSQILAAMHHGEVPEPRLRHLPDIEPDASMPRREGVRRLLSIGALIFPIIVSCKILPQNIVCSRWLVLTTCVQLSFLLEEEVATAEEQSAVPFHPDDEACFLITFHSLVSILLSAIRLMEFQPLRYPLARRIFLFL